MSMHWDMVRNGLVIREARTKSQYPGWRSWWGAVYFMDSGTSYLAAPSAPWTGESVLIAGTHPAGSRWVTAPRLDAIFSILGSQLLSSCEKAKGLPVLHSEVIANPNPNLCSEEEKSLTGAAGLRGKVVPLLSPKKGDTPEGSWSSLHPTQLPEIKRCTAHQTVEEMSCEKWDGTRFPGH